MNHQGNFDQTPLADVLFTLMNESYSGGLRIAQGRTEKLFVFGAGFVLQADSPLPEEGLLQLLRNDGSLDDATFERVEQLCARDTGEEKALLSLKVLGPKELVLALRERNRRRCVSCFGWTSGEWSLDPSKQAPKGSEAFRVDVIDIVCRGLVSYPVSDALLQRVSAIFPRYPSLTETFEDTLARLVISSEIRGSLEGLDPNATVWTQLGAKGGAQLSQGVLASLLVLEGTGALEFSDKAEGEAQVNPTAPVVETAEETGPSIEVLVAGSDAAKAQEVAEQAQTSAAAEKKERPSDEAKALTKEIEAKHAQLAELDYYEMLGIEKNASPSEIKRSYLKAAKRFHPDALSRHGLGDLKDKAGEVFGVIGKAYTVLSDPAQRRDYDQGGAADIDTDRLMQAEMFYRQAEIMFRSGRFTDAAPLLENTVKLWPEEAAYQAALGWALFKKRPSEPERAREHLEEAISMCDNDAELFFHFSVVLKKLGESAAANAALARARAIDPSVG